MKDAFGGILNLFIIIVVLLLIVGLLGLAVNYTKAFRMKNYIITAFENFEAAGECKKGSACFTSIEKKAREISFSPKKDLHCPNGYTAVEGLFCYRKKSPSITQASKKGIIGTKVIYAIHVEINIELPIINQVMGMTVFGIDGDTRVIVKKG